MPHVLRPVNVVLKLFSFLLSRKNAVASSLHQPLHLPVTNAQDPVTSRMSRLCI